MPRDEELLSACASGDASALNDLFQRYGAEVRGTLVRLRLVDRRDLDDVVQTTFLEVRRSAGRFAGRAAVGTWIVGVAINTARHHVRGESRRRAALHAAAQSMRESRRNPDDEVAHRQILERLGPALAALPADLRTAFMLCEVEGMRGTDVARILRVPEGTVWRRLHQARVRLRASAGVDGRPRDAASAAPRSP